jgi:tRNA threonylcarbamoyl adenosine modification protein (Sua5/YciO/YrdC/YwlC family)
MLVKIYNENPNQKEILKIVEILQRGGVIIYPTDTIYGIGCDIHNNKAIERIARLKGIKSDKANFSFICYDLSHLSDFTKHVDNETYKLMRRCLPGPFTFILKASNNVPKIFKSKKKTVGIRIPDNNICREIVKALGNPILTTSIKDDDDLIEYTTDPELIYEKYEKMVDAVIDGGYGMNIPSTIIDCSEGDVEIVRQGLGVLE